MADQLIDVDRIGDWTRERAAFEMMQAIALGDDQSLRMHGHNKSAEWILRTYSACLKVVRGGSPETAISELPQG